MIFYKVNLLRLKWDDLLKSLVIEFILFSRNGSCLLNFVTFFFLLICIVFSGVFLTKHLMLSFVCLYGCLSWILFVWVIQNQLGEDKLSYKASPLASTLNWFFLTPLEWTWPLGTLLRPYKYVFPQSYFHALKNSFTLSFIDLSCYQWIGVGQWPNFSDRRLVWEA